MAANFRVAAQRTYRDAAYLEQHQRIANADHLYGLAAECALKAILVGLGVIPPQGPPPKDRWRTHIEKVWDQYSAYVHGQGYSRYPVLSPNPFDDWDVAHRYEDEDFFSSARLKKHSGGALAAQLVLEQAILDGVVT